MRVLHVSSGFRPWLVNGLVTYAEDLMQAQVDDGHQVACFFPGRQYPVFTRPRLHRWSRGGVRMYEWLNSPIVVGALRGTADPERELADRGSEEQLREVLVEFAPEVVHVHDLGGLPSSLLDVVHAAGVPLAMSLHDYLVLCPTVRLYDAEGENCLRTEPGPMCAVCCRDAPMDNAEIRQRTIGFEGRRAAGFVPGLLGALDSPAVARVATGLSRRVASEASPRAPEGVAVEPGPHTSPDAYQRRRDVNLERLNRCDALLAPSRRVVEVYEALGVRRDRLRHLRTTVSHLERLTPRRIEVSGTIRFGVLNAFVSPEKGSLLMLDVLDRLRGQGLGGRFELVVGGEIAPDLRGRLGAHEEVRLLGPYTAASLDGLLDRVDVGIVPSVWEEILGFVGLEFLAKGIPVIGNARGGIVDYTRDGETGWLNRSASAQELASIMAGIIACPDQIARLNEQLLSAEVRAGFVTPMAQHASEVQGLYEELSRDRPAPRRATPARGSR